MSLIQDKDVKSLAELQAQGGDKPDLIHDSKIYITAKGIKTTLAEAIESGEIADGNRFGADVKNFAYTFSDGSQEEYNVDVPFVNGNGNTQLNITFEIKDYEVAQLYVNGMYYSKYISDTVTPDRWWKIVNDNAIEIKGDITGEAWPINFIVFRGSEIPVVPSVFSGLKIEHEAFGYTDTPTGDNVQNVYVSNGFTVIEFSFDMLQHDVPFVYINNELYPTYSPSNQTGKWYKKINSRTIQLSQDYSQDHNSFYVAVFQGKSFIDEFGNMVVTLKPEIASFILQSPSGDKWNVACTVAGELEVESVQTSEPADLILFRRDDGTILELTINDEGEFEAVEQTTAGILFENIYLSDIDGLVWELGALDDNTLYTTQHGKNFFQLLRPSGMVLKQITAMENNAVYESTGYVEENDLQDVTSEPNQTITTTVVRKKNGKFSLYFWDTLKQKWEDWLGTDSDEFTTNVPIGSSVTWHGYKDRIPANYRVCEGGYLLKSEYPELYAKIGTLYGESSDGLSFALPDSRGRTERSVDESGQIDPDLSTRSKPSGADTSDVVGSIQEDQYKSHTHPFTAAISVGGVHEQDGGWLPDMGNRNLTTGASGGNETRMKNIYVYKIIRVK